MKVSEVPLKFESSAINLMKRVSFRKMITRKFWFNLFLTSDLLNTRSEIFLHNILL